MLSNCPLLLRCYIPRSISLHATCWSVLSSRHRTTNLMELSRTIEWKEKQNTAKICSIRESRYRLKMAGSARVLVIKANIRELIPIHVRDNWKRSRIKHEVSVPQSSFPVSLWCLTNKKQLINFLLNDCFPVWRLR